MKYPGTLSRTRRAMRMPTLSQKRAKKASVRIGVKRLHRMKDGPVSSLWLHSAGTLPFRIGQFFGYYDKENKWVEL